LLQGITVVEVECLPGDLVDAIEVDISAIERLDQALHVSDLPVPRGVEILSDPEEMVVRLVPLEEEEEPTVEGEELPIPAEVEVITEAREDREARPV
jgi:large subunit ribosomal protein L25